MSYEIEGKIILIEDTVIVSDKFKKREFVIEKSEENNGKVWVDTIKFQAVQAKCELLDTLQVGDTVKVSFNIKGNKWEKDGKTSYFNNLDAWRVEVVSNYGFNPIPEHGESQNESGDLNF